jgi:hypothetical protein
MNRLRSNPEVIKDGIMRIQFAARCSPKLLGIALVLLLGLAAQASAATITKTYTGTVKYGFDSSGAFGASGIDLTGANYTLVFSSDPSPATYSTFSALPGNPLSGDQIFGATSAVLTINGHAQSFAPTSSSFDIAAYKPGFGQVTQQAGGPTGAAFVSLTMNNPGPDFPTSVLQDASIASCVTCTARMSFFIVDKFISGGLNFGTLTVGSTPPVAATPIPATLPLLVSALGGLGFAGWRRREAAA